MSSNTDINDASTLSCTVDHSNPNVNAARLPDTPEVENTAAGSDITNDAEEILNTRSTNRRAPSLTGMNAPRLPPDRLNGSSTSANDYQAQLHRSIPDLEAGNAVPATNFMSDNPTSSSLLRQAPVVLANAQNAEGMRPSDPNSEAEIEEEERDDVPSSASLVDLIDESKYPKVLTSIKGTLMPPSKPGECVGVQSMIALNSIIHGVPGDGQFFSIEAMEYWYFLHYKLKRFTPGFAPLPKEFARHLLHLIDYLEDPSTLHTSQDFTDYLKRLGLKSAIKASDVTVSALAVVGLNDVYTDVSSTTSLIESVSSLFPISDLKPESFSMRLSDILDAGLDVQPTDYLVKHLSFQGKTVYILLPNVRLMSMLQSCHYNRFAKILGIASLGPEVLASLHALYSATPQLTELANNHHLRPKEKDFSDLFSFTLEVLQGFKPDLLSGRLDQLEALLRRERVWWRVLRRDILRRAREQPFQFWAAMLAALFSITTIIQTVMSIVSCIYTIRAYKIAQITVTTSNSG